MFYKRRNISLLLLVIYVIFFFGCVNEVPMAYKSTTYKKVCVKYLGGEDSSVALLQLSDEKNVLIDGGGYEATRTKIAKILDDASATKIDYLFLNVPLDKGVENALKLSETYEISVVYELNMKEGNVFKKYNQLLSLPNTKKESAVIGEVINGEDYFIAVLSPDSLFKESVYTSEEVAKVSPVIYFEYGGVRFLFLGESDNASQTRLLENYRSGVMKVFFEKYGREVVLENIDYLHVSCGSAKTINEDLLEILKSKNAVITSSYNSYEQNLSTALVSKLYESSENIKIWQCALQDLTVTIDENAEVTTLFE